jgi:pilus assembly protein CpaC
MHPSRTSERTRPANDRSLTGRPLGPSGNAVAPRWGGSRSVLWSLCSDARVGRRPLDRAKGRAVGPPFWLVRTGQATSPTSKLWLLCSDFWLLFLGMLLATLSGTPAAQAQATAARDLFMAVGKSSIIDSPVDIERVLVADGEVAEAVAVSPREVVVNGKAPGQTTLIVWQRAGSRLLFDLTVQASTTRLDAVNRELHEELAGQDIRMTVEGKDVFLRGTANDMASAQRAAAIAGTLGTVVNLLNVDVPPAEAQILLKVRFADVDRTALTELGTNFVSTGAGNTTGSVSTGQFTPPGGGLPAGQPPALSLSNALNIFLFRPDLNLGATIQALQSRQLVEILAEPNVLAINGKRASFLAGGEFPYPTLQGGAGGVGQITVAFREFGVRLSFLPILTVRGTIRLQVTPEVSALDAANGLTYQGVTIPGLDMRRVQTEIELEPDQSFVIGGLLDNRVTENLSKIPGLGDIPLLGKLFQSKSVTKNNTELLVLVTPELVRPIPADQARPEIAFPRTDFLTTRKQPPQTPGLAVTGPVPVEPPVKTIPLEQLIQSEKKLSGDAAGNSVSPQVQFVPVPVPVMAPTEPQAPAPYTPPAAAPAAPAQGNH